MRRNSFTVGGRLPLNTSGGQLSVGQAGAAGGYLGLVEAIRQLTGQTLGAKVENARLGLVSGFGMINYDRGLCTGAAVLGSVMTTAALSAEASAIRSARCGCRRCRRPRAAARRCGSPLPRPKAASSCSTASNAARFSIRRASACVNCLSHRLEWREVDGAGELISDTVLHHSNELYYRERVPFRLGTVRLDAGPSLLAHLHGDCARRAGARARARASRQERAGGADRAAAEGYGQHERTIRCCAR